MSTTKRFPHVSGDAAESMSWIAASALTESKKECLLNFVKRFPSLRFFKQERPESDPAWLRETTSTLAGMAPGDLCWFRFRTFDHPISHKAEPGDIWYHRLSFVADVTAEYDRIFMDYQPLVFVAFILDDLSSLLAMKVGPGADEGVYEFKYADVKNAGERKGSISVASARLAFDSYANMLNRICAIKLEGEVIVNAL